MNFSPDDIVKSCRKLERGLRFGPEGIRACQVGPYASPIYWTEEEASSIDITKEMIVNQRERIFLMLNDTTSETACKQCDMVEYKPFREVDFNCLGHIDHAPRTICNLRCNYCGYTHAEDRGDLKNGFVETGYDSLKILSLFTPDDVSWDSFVDFNGGETSLIKNIGEYLDFFKKMRIRVLLYTNAVNFSSPIYNGLREGSIEWVVTSIDCGTPSTYKATKRGDVYAKVVENSVRYAHAAENSCGNFAVKYIFTNDNVSDDDVIGFAYAMLAIRPQKVWLTFDFNPFGEIGGSSDDFGTFDFTKQIEAYVKLYLLLVKHGITPVHYTEGHLATISKAGRKLLDIVKHQIAIQQMKRVLTSDEVDSLYIKDFRANDIQHPGTFEALDEYRLTLSPFVLASKNDQKVAFELKNKRVVVAPAWQYTRKLIKIPEIAEATIIAILDRSTAIHGKHLEGIPIHDYSQLRELAPEIVLVAPPEQHRLAVLQSVYANAGPDTRVVVLS
jgi:organic radical activating enzyme